MIAGQSYAVSVTMQNTGMTVWSPSTLHALGSQYARDNATWGMSRVSLPAPVLPGGTVTFSFTITASKVVGRYVFGWQMVQEYVEWFGARSNPIWISDLLTPPPPPSEEPTLCFDPIRKKMTICGE